MYVCMYIYDIGFVYYIYTGFVYIYIYIYIYIYVYTIQGTDKQHYLPLLDIDECAVMNGCHESAVCKNTIGSYQCFCQSGYTGDGFSCKGNI